MAQQVVAHNRTVFDSLEAGDLVEFDRGLFSHWAVYEGGSEVVHLAGDEINGRNVNLNSGNIFTICGTFFNKAFVRVDNFWVLAVNSKVYKKNWLHGSYTRYSREEIIKRAMDMVGKIRYNLQWGTCEHFAMFCRYGNAIERKHNMEVLKDIVPGDLVEFKRGVYSHWAVYKGDGQVIHPAADENADLKSCNIFTSCVLRFVRVDNCWVLADDSKVYKKNSLHGSYTQYSREEIIKRAMDMDGEIRFNLQGGTCEHFAMFCRYGNAIERKHNMEVLKDLIPGDLVEFKRGVYSHWAVYQEDGRVIHLAGVRNKGVMAYLNSGCFFTISGRQFEKAEVREDNFFEVAGVSKAYKDSSYTPFNPEEILQRAEKKMKGEIVYNILWNNCEHFAKYCRYGVNESAQVDYFVGGVLRSLFRNRRERRSFTGPR